MTAKFATCFRCLECGFVVQCPSNAVPVRDHFAETGHACFQELKEAGEVLLVYRGKDRIQITIDAAAPENQKEKRIVATTKFDALINESPDMMAELMREFVTVKEYNARAKIRMKMKILLDLASVDTKYPDIPALQTNRPRQIGQGMANYGNQYPYMQADPLNNVANRIEPIPGANPEDDNADILEAGGNVPAPANR